MKAVETGEKLATL